MIWDGAVSSLVQLGRLCAEKDALLRLASKGLYDQVGLDHDTEHAAPGMPSSSEAAVHVRLELGYILQEAEHTGLKPSELAAAVRAHAPSSPARRGAGRAGVDSKLGGGAKKNAPKKDPWGEGEARKPSGHAGAGSLVGRQERWRALVATLAAKSSFTGPHAPHAHGGAGAAGSHGGTWRLASRWYFTDQQNYL